MMDASNRQPCEDLLWALREVLGRPTAPLSLHEPEFAGNEWSYVKECIDTGWVSSVGKFVDGFERQLAEVTGARYAVAVVNGTAALHIALQLAGVRAGDEVLVPALSFVGTANSVVHAGAVPHFVDSGAETLGVDPEALRAHLGHVAERSAGGLRNRMTGRRISAIVPMHAFGHAVDLDGLMEVAQSFELPVIEDAAEALGSTYKGQHTGTFGLMGILSFNGNKVITTGGGGAILTNDESLARRAKHVTTTAKRPHRWAFWHDEVAFNYRMPNINAALGCAQLERLPEFLSRKRRLAQRYREVFARLPDFEFVDQPAGVESNFWLAAIRLRQPDAALRDALLSAVNDAGYQCRPVWTLLNKLPMYVDCPSAFLPVAQAIEDSLINLPSSPKLAGMSA
jgi:perosamine synthetase